MNKEESDTEYICQNDGMDEDGTPFKIYKVIGVDKSSKITPGKTRMYLNKEKDHNHENVLVFDSEKVLTEVSTDKSRYQRDSARTNDLPILVLYSIPLDHQNHRSSVEIANDVFGICDGCTPDPVNLKSQYLGCSGGKMNIVPACSRPSDSCYGNPEIVNGVLEVEIPINVQGQRTTTVTSYDHMMAYYALRDYGINIWDFHLLHVIPDEANWGGAAAWAYLPGKVSAFQDSYANRMGVQMHEIGHNLGMQHSGKGSNQYNDHSCLMGNPSYSDDGPQICFNGAKSWSFGWFEDDSLAVDVVSNQNFDGLLVGVDDYANDRYTSNRHYVVLKVIDPSQAEDYYIMFNRKKGFNGGVSFAADMVTVTASQPNQVSWNKGNLDANENSNEFAIDNFGESGRRLVVKVCDISYSSEEELPDTARVLVYMDNDLSCETTGTTEPTSTPTAVPTDTPSLSPTYTSSDFPSNIQASAPTGTPTIVPSFTPTSTPTTISTFQPSIPPTLMPTKSSTSSPTNYHSSSLTPTVPSTISPTKFPCGVEESYFSMKVQVDDKAVEDKTTFRVMKILNGRNGRERINLFVKRIFSSRDNYFEWGQCLNINHCYRFVVRDFGRDGICCEHGDGYYELSFNGKLEKNK